MDAHSLLCVHIFLLKAMTAFFLSFLHFFCPESKHKSLSTQSEVFLGVLNEKGFRMEQVFLNIFYNQVHHVGLKGLFFLLLFNFRLGDFCSSWQ